MTPRSWFRFHFIMLRLGPIMAVSDVLRVLRHVMRVDLQVVVRLLDVDQAAACAEGVVVVVEAAAAAVVEAAAVAAEVVKVEGVDGSP